MPTPRKGEKRKDWLDRCMGSDEQKKSFPDDKQRYAVCQSKWTRRAEMTAMANSVMKSNGEMRLYGTVGAGLVEVGDGEPNYFTAADVSSALIGYPRGKTLTIRLNSGGGVAHQGAAIYAILAQHAGKKTVVIEGVAASAASIIAMAGDEIVMMLGATMMIHDPAGITIGTPAAHAKTKDALDTIAENMATIYAERSGKTPKEARKVMQDETWFTAQQAVDAGFADRVEKGGGRRIEATAFDYRVYQHAPEQFVALATDRNWQLRSDEEDETEAAIEGEVEMTEAEKKAAADKRKAAITAACKIAGKDAKAEAFIAGDKSVEDVITALQTEADAEKAEKDKAAGQETPAQMQARIRTEEQKRCSDITAACSMAGKPSKATAFIAENKTVSEVIAALAADKSEPEKQIHARGGQGGDGGRGQGGDVMAGWDKQAKRINARFGG